LPGYFALEDDYYTSHITLEDALSHRSGLPRHDLAYGWDNRRRHADTIDVILTMKDLPLTAEPRTKWQYCNIMYATVGQALTMLGGLRFGDVLRKLIWEPIGMRSTTTSFAEAKASKNHLGKSRLSRGYFWNEDHYLPEPYPNVDAIAGAGATISSVNDYALWIQTLLNAGSNDSSPISDAIYRDITTSRAIMNDIPGAGDPSLPPLYTLGWFVAMLGSHKLVTHSGSVTGFGANVYLLPEEGLGIVTMANTMGSSNVAGALIFLQILKRIGQASSVHDAAHLNTLHESVISYPQAHQQESRRTKTENISAEQKLALPGHPKEYLGLYRHPAYGVFNVSLVDEPSAYPGRHASNVQETIPTTSDPIALHVRPSRRTWPYEIFLKHESNTLFAAEVSVSVFHQVTHFPLLTSCSGFMVRATLKMDVVRGVRLSPEVPKSSAVKRWSPSLWQRSGRFSKEISMARSRS
jgi:CubicO group peptidase (beta-lactamase class C family)